jgi:Ca-activated chloride channel family protein
MIVFADPWLGLVLPLPLLVWWLAPPRAEAQAGVRVPFLRSVAALSGQTPRATGVIARRGFWGMSLLVLCWALVLIALMRPQRIEPPLRHDQPTRDLLLLVDLSASMDTKDFTNAAGQTVDRVTAVKEVLKEFLGKRQGDRVGIVVFGTTPFPLVPFTSDLTLVRELLDEMQAGMAGPRTALGDAIGLGIGLFAKSSMKHKTMVALTDGNDTASHVLPGDAARIARDRGITIHTVAIGDPLAIGEDMLDEPVLQDVAQATGGGFYRALDRKQLDQIYTRLDQVETHEVETVLARPRVDLYWWPLAALLIVTLVGQGARIIPWSNLRMARAAA